jgi:hypothetical protein
MADGELGFKVDLGHGAVQFREVKQRIVAEAVGAAWSGENIAFDGTVADGEDVAVSGGGEDAVVSRAALGEGDACEEGDEVEVVALVEWKGLRGVEGVVVGKAGGADAGMAVEGVDFEAGVVGYDDVAGCVAGVVDGLEAGVAFEGGLVFGGGGDLYEVGQWSEGDVARGSCGKVSKLTGVGSGDMEDHWFCCIRLL